MRDLNRVHLGALRAVEAVARLGTLRLAAGELGVTPGAVSQQIIKAEAQLDRKLFERQPKGLVPTPVGQDIADHLTEGFSALARGVAATRLRTTDAITISVAPVFAGKWLVRRLGRFMEAHPGIRVRIEASVELVQPQTAGIDACIRVGAGGWEHVRAEEMLPLRVFPVCAPAVAERLNDLADLRDVSIIRDRYSVLGWDCWLKPNGMTEDQLGDGPVFSDASLCLDAAVAGQGVFLAWESLAEDALAADCLVAPFPGRFEVGYSYWFVEDEKAPPTPQIDGFRLWLIEELRNGQAV